jgi:hypothetical protein
MVMVRVTGSPAYNREGLRLYIQEGEQPPAEARGLLLKIELRALATLEVTPPAIRRTAKLARFCRCSA